MFCEMYIFFNKIYFGQQIIRKIDIPSNFIGSIKYLKNLYAYNTYFT